MKLNDIKDKKRIIKNTPTDKLIKGLTALVLTGTFAFGYYVIYHQGERLSYFFEHYLKITSLDKQRAQLKQKPLQERRYQDYLREKKVYSKQLEEENLKRLERIKKLNEKDENKSGTSNTDDKDLKQTPPINTPPPQPQPSNRYSYKALIYYYISFGYWKPNNQEQVKTSGSSQVSNISVNKSDTQK